MPKATTQPLPQGDFGGDQILLDKPLHILLVEDNEADFLLTRDLLKEAFGAKQVVDLRTSYPDALHALEVECFDVCLLDCRISGHNGLDLLRHISLQQSPRLPVIMLTGTENRETDIEAMSAGAADCLLKQELSAPLLERSIRYAIERKKVEHRLFQLSHFDPLTGLANRTLFYLKLKDGIHQAERTGESLALYFLDLDHFKEINDTLGHQAGDQLLVDVSSRLKTVTRQTDTVVRLGGDEFAIIANHLHQDQDSSQLASKLIEIFSEPVTLNNQTIIPHTSIGIALFPAHGSTPDQLLRHADLALYQAKEAGRSTFKFYDQNLDAQAQEYRALQMEMEHGLENHEFSMLYQPMLDTRSKAVIGAEALVRWKHPSRGVISPAQFIPMAETSGLIVPLGTSILEMVCTQMKDWNEAGLPKIPVAVNLSPLQFRNGDFLETVARAISASGINPQDLELEITENTLMETGPDITELLHKLHALGPKLVIDDFGTGYSSLAYLKRFPVHKLKIDRTFIEDLEGDQDDAIITRTIINLGQSMNLEVIAEGVETKAQLDFLEKEGCRQAQGFYFSRPLTPEKFVQWVQERPCQAG